MCNYEMEEGRMAQYIIHLKIDYVDGYIGPYTSVLTTALLIKSSYKLHQIPVVFYLDIYETVAVPYKGRL